MVPGQPITSQFDAAETAPYLIARGLLRPRAIVAGDCDIRDVSRRHTNWEIHTGDGAGYLLKQAGTSERAAEIAHEAAVYRHLGAQGTDGLKRLVPALVTYDATSGVLVLELVPDAVPFGDTPRAAVAVGPARSLGRALATLHEVDGMGTLQAVPPPSILRLPRLDLDLYRELSLGSLQLVRLLQQHPDFGWGLESLALAWQPLALVHYDLKWENVLVTRARWRRRPQLWIVDWEMAGMGDPCWDVGAIFGEYLRAWLASAPFAPGETPGAAIARAALPLPRIQPAIRAFWAAYLAGSHPPDPATRLLRATSYAAARLIQTTLEHAQTAVHLSGFALLALQVALNILQRPQEAAEQLLGLSLSEAAG